MTQVYKFECPDCGHVESLISGAHPSDVDHDCPRCGTEMSLDSTA